MKRKFMCVTLLLTLLSLTVPISNPRPIQAEAADVWWDEAWPYRIPVTVGGAGVAEVNINFTEALNTLGLNHALLDVRAVRVVAYNGNAPGATVPYIETYSTLLDDADAPQIGWSSSGVYWDVNDGSAEADATRFSQGLGSVKTTVENWVDGYGYPGVELRIASGDAKTDWSAYESFIYDVWPEVNASARDQAPDLYWYKLYGACDGGSVTQGGPPLALDQWNAVSVSLNPLDRCGDADGRDLSNITRMEFHTRDNDTVNGNGGLWDAGDVLTLWFDNLRLVNQDSGLIRWSADGSTTQYYIYFDTLTHEGHPQPTLATGLVATTHSGIASAPETGGYYHQITGASTGDLTVWAAPSIEKILKTMLPPIANAPLRVTAAKGEFEPFQLVVHAPSAQTLTVSVSDFVKGADTLPAPTLHRVDYVNITTAGDHFDRFGWWPDPLFPLDNGSSVNFPAGENQPLWFTVNVPWDAEPGVYQATVTIGTATVPVALQVWDFALPREIHLDSEWGFSWSRIVEVYGGTRGGVQPCYWTLVDALYEDFADHRLTPKGVGWPAGLSFDYNCDTGVLDPDHSGNVWYFASTAQKYLRGDELDNETGFPSFLIKGPNDNWPPASRPSSFCGQSRGTEPPGNSGYNTKWFQYWSAVSTYLGNHPDYAAKGYYHIVNEPQTFDDYNIVAYLAQQTKANAPNVRILLSEQVEAYIYNNPTYGAAKIDIWMPTITTYEPIKSHDRQLNHGEDVWWYYLYGDDPPLPNPILMSHPGIEARITPWLAWAERVDGLLHYDATDWSPNPWTTPNVTGKDNGDGFFFYPPNKDGSDLSVCGENGHRLVPSIRWENLRDGMEDYEYLWLLAGGDPQINTPNAADDYVAQIVGSRTLFSHVPTDLADARAAIASALAPEPEPPMDVQLNGASNGFIHTRYAFSATVAPTATLPLTFTWTADGQSPVAHLRHAFIDSVDFQWAAAGTQALTVTVANAGGQVMGTHALALDATACVQATDTLSATLVYTDEFAHPTTVFIPAGAVTTTTTFCYAPLPPISEAPPAGYDFAQHAFDLTSDNGFAATGYLTISIRYDDRDLAAVREAGVRVYTVAPAQAAPAQAWAEAIDAANACYQRDQVTIAIGTPEQLAPYYVHLPEQNQLDVRLCHLTNFALVGVERVRVYLPLVLRY